MSTLSFHMVVLGSLLLFINVVRLVQWRIIFTSNTNYVHHSEFTLRVRWNPFFPRCNHTWSSDLCEALPWRTMSHPQKSFLPHPRKTTLERSVNRLLSLFLSLFLYDVVKKNKQVFFNRVLLFWGLARKKSNSKPSFRDQTFSENREERVSRTVNDFFFFYFCHILIVFQMYKNFQ